TGAVPGMVSAGGMGAAEDDKPLANLTLQGISVSFGQRVAVVNGKMLREGEIVPMGNNGATIRARRIGSDFCEIEGGAGLVMLRLDDARDAKKSPGGENAAP